MKKINFSDTGRHDRGTLCRPDTCHQRIRSCQRCHSGPRVRGTYDSALFHACCHSGLFIGCLLSNTITGCALFDIIFGSIATLLGAVGTYLLRRHKWLAPVSPIIANTIIVPFVLFLRIWYAGTIPYLMLTVGIGEVLSCGVLGMILFICTEQIQNDTLRSAKLNIRRSESPPATADAASVGHDRNIFPADAFFFQIYLLYVIKQFPFASK